MEISSPDELNIEDLRIKINDLKKQMPKHSVPPTMILDLEDLEDELEKALSAFGGKEEQHA